MAVVLAALGSAFAQTPWIEDAALRSTTVSLRLYKNMPDQSTRADAIEGRIERGTALVPGGRVSLEDVVALFPTDQDDERVRLALGQTVYFWHLHQTQEEDAALLRFPLNGNAEPAQLRILDAKGTPIEGATVSVSVCRTREKGPGMTIKLADVTQDATSTTLPAFGGDLHETLITAAHPRFGIAQCRVVPRARQEIRTGLVRETTPERERAARGQVLDPEGKPISGARVVCEHVRTPGQGLIQTFDIWVVTDESGRFAVYAPDDDRSEERGDLVPPNSTYHLKIEPPAALGLLPMPVPVGNDKEQLIRFQRGGSKHTARFFIAERELCTPDDLARVAITITEPKGKSRRNVTVSELLQCGFPEGEYTAGYSDSQGHRYEFEPLNVNTTSPEKLVFRISPGIRYTGRVIHGVTSEPLAGAFVVGTQAVGRGNLAWVTDEEWQVLERADAATLDRIGPNLKARMRNPDDPDLKALMRSEDNPDDLQHVRKAWDLVSRDFGLEAMTRTDSQGRFVLQSPPGQKPYGVLVFAKDFLPRTFRAIETRPDETHTIRVPIMRMYAAAKVVVHPVQSSQEAVSVKPDWVFDQESYPDWARELLDAQKKEYQHAFVYYHWLKCNETAPVFVPAGVPMRLNLRTPYTETLRTIRIPTVFSLPQGQTQDLGKWEFMANPIFSVQVVDEKGSPIEGVPVRIRTDDVWSVAHNSDKLGLTTFSAEEGSEIEAGVLAHTTTGSLNASRKCLIKQQGEAPLMFQLSVPADVSRAALEHKE